MLSLIFPTYKESAGLPSLLPKVMDALKGIPHEVIIVDDDSPDRTWEVAQKLTQTYPTLRVIRRVGRRGLSSAVIEGFLCAKGDVLAVADADGQHDLRILPQLYASVQTHKGIAVGSRYVEGGSVGQWDERRHAMSRAATKMAIALCKVQVKDPMSGFFALDRSLFEKTVKKLNPKGFKILLDVLIHVPSSTPVEEVPFIFGLREQGESKLSRRVQVEFVEYLYDATFGRYIPLTLVKYCIVGVLGVAVQLLGYAIVSRLLGGSHWNILGFSTPLLVGIEAAIAFNFLLNNSWVFSAVKLRGKKALLGFITYNVCCLFGALANYAIVAHLSSQGVERVSSIVAGAVVGMVWNYTMSRMVTWRA